METQKTRCCLYLVVSGKETDTRTHEMRLRAVAEARGWEIAEVYEDQSLRLALWERPRWDRMMRDAHMGKFHVVMAWSLDRLGRSLQDLVQTVTELRNLRVDLYLEQQGLDTTQSVASQAVSDTIALFREAEAAIQRESVLAGLERPKTPKRELHPRRVGLPERVVKAIMDELAMGRYAMKDIARRYNVGIRTVKQIKSGEHRLSAEIVSRKRDPLVPR